VCEAAAKAGCLGSRTWKVRACWLLAVVCTEGVVPVSYACDFPDRGGNAGSLANQSSSSGRVMVVVGLLFSEECSVGVAAMSLSCSSPVDLGILSLKKAKSSLHGDSESAGDAGRSCCLLLLPPAIIMVSTSSRADCGRGLRVLGAIGILSKAGMDIAWVVLRIRSHS
jgi:hypothetical protein